MILRNEKRGKWDNTFSCRKEVGLLNCKLNSSLRMGFGWLMDTHKLTLSSNKITKDLKEANGTGLNIIRCPRLNTHHFFDLEWTKHAFFNPLF